MPTNVDELIGKLRPAQRRKVEARAAWLVAEEMTLRELRHARKLTQVQDGEDVGYHTGQCLAPRKTERSPSVHTQEDRRCHGRKAFACR